MRFPTFANAIMFIVRASTDDWLHAAVSAAVCTSSFWRAAGVASYRTRLIINVMRSAAITANAIAPLWSAWNPRSFWIAHDRNRVSPETFGSSEWLVISSLTIINFIFQVGPDVVRRLHLCR